MKKLVITTALLVVCILGIELFLRQYYGFCDAVLLRADPDYEYISLPHQARFRLGNHICYNSVSMRSAEVDSSAFIILGFGDSVINGGGYTDQDSLATSILTSRLTERYHKKVQFLNISAGSWGPDNCYAYLKKHGDFHAKCIFLFVSSHDAYDNMDFEKIIDVQDGFSSKQYPSAIFELVNRYLVPHVRGLMKKSSPGEQQLGINKKKANSLFNAGFPSFLSYTREKGIPLVIYLHADAAERKKGFYNEQGQEIISFARRNNVELIMDVDNDLKPADYRDYIHFNASGQHKMAMTVFAYTTGLFEKYKW
ncbi:hypothetical protein V9K67_05510 [Paraflavisolibacter sp. H34]|uniref:hypothetical protein n=1 Tax=Huijunlia imazamoxiresistens TaxID=3127457 RepID=UPI003017835E